MHHLPRAWKIPIHHWNNSGTSPISMAHFSNRYLLLIVADVFSKYFLVRKLANSSSAAVCAEIATIVTELGLPHIIRSDNGPCYNSKEFQQLLQHYNITHHTSSPHHPRSNGFVERMVGVAKKLMAKLEAKGNHGFQVCMITELHHSPVALPHHCSS